MILLVLMVTLLTITELAAPKCVPEQMTMELNFNAKKNINRRDALGRDARCATGKWPGSGLRLRRAGHLPGRRSSAALTTGTGR